MEITPECVPCLFRRVAYECRVAGADDETALRVMRKVCEIVGRDLEVGICSVVLATPVHRFTREALNGPYEPLKERAWRVAAALLPDARRFVEEANDPFRAACVVAVAGNLLDFGAPLAEDPGPLREGFSDHLARGLQVDDTATLRSWIEGRQVLFFTDNAGEALLDLPLIGEIRRRASSLWIVAKGAPVLSDATVDDILAHGIDRYADRVVSTGNDAVGMDPDALPDEVRRGMANGIVVAKGMANAEGLSHWHTGRIAYLLKAKCQPVADVVGARLGDSVVRCLEQ